MKAIGIILGILFIILALIVSVGSVICLIDKLVFDIMEILEKDGDME